MHDVATARLKRSTIYFEPDLHKVLRIKSAETSRSISNLVNDAIREALSGDAEDLAAFGERAAEPLISYEEMLVKLREDGRI
uniref:CopG family transcriptional regulator n=1 Tax=Candidatus Kentrum sp. TUN TaxID=2126343 RepID=A0A451AVF6_9GAMM|nr:MAG: hypothetical protein BECKTUN1418F_GA0071002_12263 [Candidatus Kentron sp. TUN]VFK70024.1 MAG: hypothetical protein BECKTUN1418E_GA0071001_12273 [Candidatus Kentron sp. TUN]